MLAIQLGKMANTLGQIETAVLNTEGGVPTQLQAIYHKEVLNLLNDYLSIVEVSGNEKSMGEYKLFLDMCRSVGVATDDFEKPLHPAPVSYRNMYSDARLSFWRENPHLMTGKYVSGEAINDTVPLY